MIAGGPIVSAAASRKPTFLTKPGTGCPERACRHILLLKTVLDCSFSKGYGFDGF